MWLWLVLALLAGHFLVLAIAPNAPLLQDYPDWVYQGALFANLLAGHATPGYALHHYPVPNSLTTIGIGILTLALGWKIAAKLWLMLVLAALTAGSVRLVHRIGGNESVLPALACSILLGLDLWNGAINFQLGVAFFLFLLAHLLRSKRSEWKTALLLLLCFSAHMLPCAAGLLALTALALQERSVRRMWPAIPVMILSLWYGLCRTPYGPRGSMLHLVPALLAPVLLLLWFARDRLSTRKTRCAMVVGLFLPVAWVTLQAKMLLLAGSLGVMHVFREDRGATRVLFSESTFSAAWLVGLIAGLMLISLVMRECFRLTRSNDPRRFLAVTALSLGTVCCLLPADALGVTGIDGRMLHLALATGLAVLSLQSSPAVKGLGCLAVLLCVVNLYQFSAVQLHPATISVSGAPDELPGASPVIPTTRMRYYHDLSQGNFPEWIFPSALFHQLPR